MSLSEPSMKMTDPKPISDTSADAASATPAEAKGTDWWAEFKAIFWLILAVLAFHSFIAKPFYIPSESMMPVLLKGDRLVVTKYPYGWSWVSPSFHILPPMAGRIFGRLPKRGDVVIVTPPGRQSEDWIKRVIGLPGDTVAMNHGQLIINGRPVKRERRPDALIKIDPNVLCPNDQFGDHVVARPDGDWCRLPVVRETLPNGRSYDTIDEGYLPDVDDYGPVRVPAGHVFLMGDNRDKSADSRVALNDGLGGPVPWGNLGGRAEFITFSLDGTSSYLNPISWFSALRSGRAGTSLRPEETQAK